jgi:transposase
MDLRERVIEAIAAGASRRETAEQFGLSASVVIIWAQRYHATGNIAPKPTGGSVSPLEEHEDRPRVSISKLGGRDPSP